MLTKNIKFLFLFHADWSLYLVSPKAEQQYNRQRNTLANEAKDVADTRLASTSYVNHKDSIFSGENVGNDTDVPLEKSCIHVQHRWGIVVGQ